MDCKACIGRAARSGAVTEQRFCTVYGIHAQTGAAIGCVLSEFCGSPFFLAEQIVDKLLRGPSGDAAVA